MFNVAREFVARFSDLSVNKIITIEASGIAPAIMVGFFNESSRRFCKKENAKNNGKYDCL